MVEGKPKGSALRTFAEFAVVIIVALALAWCITTFVVQPYEINNVGHTLLDLLRRSVYNTENESDVLIDCHRRYKSEVLKYEAESTAEFRYPFFSEFVEVIAVDYNASAGCVNFL